MSLNYRFCPTKILIITFNFFRFDFQACKHGLQVKQVEDPYRGERIDRLIRDGLILLPAEEVHDCIQYFYDQTHCDGARKLFYRMKDHYYGISEYAIRNFLNTLPHHVQKTPIFRNKAPLKPITSRKIMERHQIDLVDMQTIAAEYEGKCYRYILSVLDCFSRYLWLRPITNKASKTIAQELEKIYLEFGPPSILQSDRGSEFYGAVLELAREFHIKIIHSSPYHPESQGKLERSHATWKRKIRQMVGANCGTNWVKELPKLACNYNIGYHTGIKLSPYECLFGIKSNFVLHEYRGGLITDQSEEEMEWDWEVQTSEVSDCECDENGTVLQRHSETDDTDSETRLPDKIRKNFDSIRSEVERNAKAAEEKMISSHKAKHPPSVYSPGDLVWVKLDGKDKGVHRGGLSLRKPRCYQALVRARKDNTYTVTVMSSWRRWETVKVGVEKLTSWTRTEQAKEFPEITDSSFNSKLKSHRIFRKLINLLTQENNTPSSSTGGMQMLLSNAAEHGLTLDEDNNGRGNCLFLALQQQLEKKLGIRKTHREIRKEVVTFLSENPVIGNIYLPDFITDNPSWEAYLDQLSQDGVWGDHIALMGFSNLYHISVVIVSSLENSEPVVVEAEDGVTIGDVTLGHIAEMHYVTLQNIITLCDRCGSGNCECTEMETDASSQSVSTSDAAQSYTCSQTDSNQCNSVFNLNNDVDHNDDNHDSMGTGPENECVDNRIPFAAILSELRVSMLSGFIDKLRKHLRNILNAQISETATEPCTEGQLCINHHISGTFLYLLQTDSSGLLREPVSDWKFIKDGARTFAVISESLFQAFEHFQTIYRDLCQSYKVVFVTSLVKRMLKDAGLSLKRKVCPLLLFTTEEYDNLFCDVHLSDDEETHEESDDSEDD